MLLHALVYVSGFPALLAAHLLAFSLAQLAVWYMSFSLGVTLIWQRPGLHPTQETHPSEATGWQSMCTLLRACTCVCVLVIALYADRPFFIQTGQILEFLHRSPCRPLPACFSPASTVTVCWCSHLDCIFSFHSHYTYPHFVTPIDFVCFFASAAGVPTYSATKCCPNGFSEICPREAAALVPSKM